jgi:hypothetical protein
VTFESVFLSSTAKDLQEHRDAAYEAIEGLDGYHCVRMKDFGARDWESDDFCCRRVAECDLFVGIVGHLYGSTPQHSDQSFTEREYQAALDTSRPRLMFLAPDDFRLPTNLREPDDKWQKQLAFRDRVKKERMLDTFKSPDDLRWRVVRAIRNWERERAMAEVAPHDQPLPPFFPCPHLLQANFTGRFAERSQLTEWLEQRSEPILVIIGIGGVGKSELTWAWVQHDVVGWDLQGSSPELYSRLYRAEESPDERQPDTLMDAGEAFEGVTTAPEEPPVSGASGILWWSFYDRDADFKAFLRQAIRYITDDKLDPDIYTLSQRVDVLLRELIDRQLLFILDGFERELRAYSRLRVPYQDNEEIDRRSLSGPRACAAREARIFLRKLVASHCRSKIVITSQLLPSALEGDDGRPLPGCHVIELKGLDPREATLFMRTQGVQGSDAEIEKVCRWFDYHSLSLRSIAGRIIKDPEYPGEIRVIQPSVALKTVAREYRGISIAYASLTDELRGLTQRISGLDLPITYQDLYTSLSPLKMFNSEEELKMALLLLIDLGLITRDLATNQYGMHPVIQAYVRNRFQQWD